MMNGGITIKMSQFKMICIRKWWLKTNTCRYGNGEDLLVQTKVRMKRSSPNHEKNCYYSKTFSNTLGKCGIELVCFHTTSKPPSSLKTEPSQRPHLLSRNGTRSGDFSLQLKLGALLWTKAANPTQY